MNKKTASSQFQSHSSDIRTKLRAIEAVLQEVELNQKGAPNNWSLSESLGRVDQVLDEALEHLTHTAINTTKYRS